MYTKYEENPFAGFFNTTIVGKIYIFFLAVIHLFGITKCSKSLDLVRMG